MVYTVTNLITSAYNLSTIVSPGLETISGDQLTEGLSFLNFILSDIGLDFKKIPYYDKYDFTGVINQGEYFIPGLVEPETCVFFIQEVRYQLEYQYRKPFFGSSRAENISSLPYCWHYERAFGGGNIDVYFPPSQEFLFTVRGRFLLESVELNQDLSLTMELFYIDYLRHYLANYICESYDIELPTRVEKELAKFDAKIAEMTNFDLSMTKQSTLQNRWGYNYAQLNLGKGWFP